MRLIACKMRGQQSNPWFHFAPLARNISTRGLIKQKLSDPCYFLEAALSQTYYYSWNDLSTVVAEICEWNCMQVLCKCQQLDDISLPCREGMMRVAFLRLQSMQLISKMKPRLQNWLSHNGYKDAVVTNAKHTCTHTCTSMVPFPINWNPHWRLMHAPFAFH